MDFIFVVYGNVAKDSGFRESLIGERMGRGGLWQEERVYIKENGSPQTSVMDLVDRGPVWFRPGERVLNSASASGPPGKASGGS